MKPAISDDDPSIEHRNKLRRKYLIEPCSMEQYSINKEQTFFKSPVELRGDFDDDNKLYDGVTEIMGSRFVRKYWLSIASHHHFFCKRSPQKIVCDFQRRWLTCYNWRRQPINGRKATVSKGSYVFRKLHDQGRLAQTKQTFKGKRESAGIQPVMVLNSIRRHFLQIPLKNVFLANIPKASDEARNI
jgi:hypothetical protein